MSKYPVFNLLILFLRHLNATGQCRLVGDDTEKIIKRCITSQKIYLEEFYKLEASDQNRVIEGLISKLPTNTNERFMLWFRMKPLVNTRVPDCFQKLSSLGSVGINLESTLCPNSSEFEPNVQCHGVDEFIESISHWENLHELRLLGLGLSTCPTNLSKLRTLKILSLSYNNLSAKSFDGFNHPSLEKLYISGNKQLADLPAGVLNCSKLKLLDMAWCSFENIPSTISRLENLEELLLDFNQIKNFSHEVYPLRNIKFISLSFINKLKNAMIDFVFNPYLEKVYLSYCDSLRKLVVNIPEESVSKGSISMRLSPVDELIVSPNFAFSKIDSFECALPERLFPSCGDQLGWPEVVELCGSKISWFEIFTRCREIFPFWSWLYKYNRFCWKQEMLNRYVFDLRKDTLARDELIYLWKMIVERVQIDILGRQKSNYDCSLLYLRNLYGESVKDSLGSIKFTYVQYKPTMKSLLSALFRAINNSNLDQLTLKIYVESILEMFQRPQGEQLVYFYHLLKTLSEGCVKFEEFTQNSIAILKDYIFTMTICLKGYDQGLLDECKTRAKNMGLIPDNEVIDIADGGEHYEKQILPLFIYKFSPDWFCQIVTGIINFDEELKRQIARDLYENVEDPAVYFEYEDIENSKFPEKVKEEGVSAILIEAGFIGHN